MRATDKSRIRFLDESESVFVAFLLPVCMVQTLDAGALLKRVRDGHMPIFFYY